MLITSLFHMRELGIMSSLLFLLTVTSFSQPYPLNTSQIVHSTISNAAVLSLSHSLLPGFPKMVSWLCAVFLPQILFSTSCQNDLSSVQIYPCKSPAELSPNSQVQQPHLPCCSSTHAVAVSIVMCCGSWTYHNIPHLYSFAYDFHSAPSLLILLCQSVTLLILNVSFSRGSCKLTIPLSSAPSGCVCAPPLCFLAPTAQL